MEWNLVRLSGCLPSLELLTRKGCSSIGGISHNATGHSMFSMDVEFRPAKTWDRPNKWGEFRMEYLRFLNDVQAWLALWRVLLLTF